MVGNLREVVFNIFFHELLKVFCSGLATDVIDTLSLVLEPFCPCHFEELLRSRPLGVIDSHKIMDNALCIKPLPLARGELNLHLCFVKGFEEIKCLRMIFLRKPSGYAVSLRTA